MTKIEKENLISTLQELVESIRNLQFGNYGMAETLCQRTKMLQGRYFW
jgi:hypothetical protein